MNNKMTYWKLAKTHAFGSLTEWREACEQAKREGWSYSRVKSVTWCHPIAFLAAWILLLDTISVLCDQHK